MPATLFYFLARLRAILNCCELLQSSDFDDHRVVIVMNLQRALGMIANCEKYVRHRIAPLTLAQEQLHAIDPLLSVRGGRGS